MGSPSRLSAAVLALFVTGVVSSQSCSSDDSANPNTPGAIAGAPVRVLMLTATAGFRQDSIDTARRVMTGLGAASGEFTVTATEDLATFTAANLANFDVIFFANTSGELPFTADQKAAIVGFVANGRGFLGTHSATDTLYEWADYGRLVGAYFKEHPWTQQGSRRRRRRDASRRERDRRSLRAAGRVLYVSRQPAAAMCRCCCDSMPRRSARAATIRSRGRTRSAAAAPTTTRSGIFRRHGTTPDFSSSWRARSGGPAGGNRPPRGQTGVRPGSDRGQTGVRPGSDRGQTGVRPGSDQGQTPADPRV